MGSNMTIGKRFIITSGVLVLLCAILSGVAIVGFSGINRDVHSLATDTIPGTTYALAFSADAGRLRANYLQHMQEDDPAELQKLEQDSALTDARMAADMKNYESAITKDEDRDNFAKLQQQIDAINKGWARVLPLSRAMKDKEAYAAFKTDIMPHVYALRDQAQYIAEWNEKAGDRMVADTA